MARERKEYAERFRTIRVRTEDYNSLLVISRETLVPLVGLVRTAVPMLEAKYGIKGAGGANGDGKL